MNKEVDFRVARTVQKKTAVGKRGRKRMTLQVEPACKVILFSRYYTIAIQVEKAVLTEYESYLIAYFERQELSAGCDNNKWLICDFLKQILFP